MDLENLASGDIHTAGSRHESWKAAGLLTADSKYLDIESGDGWKSGVADDSKGRVVELLKPCLATDPHERAIPEALVGH